MTNLGTSPHSSIRRSPRACVRVGLIALLVVLSPACGADEEGQQHEQESVLAAVPADSGLQPVVDLLSNVGFTEDSQFIWFSNNEATTFAPPQGADPELARVFPKGQVYWQASVTDGREGAPYRLTVQARKVESEALRLRLQVSWLPQGAWKATDEDGNKLARNDIEVADVDSYAWETYTFEVTQAPHAINAIVYLVNAGPNAVEIANISFERLSTATGNR